MKKDKTCFFMTRLVYDFSCIILATRKRCPSDSMTGACFVFRKLIGVQWGKFGPTFWKRASQMLDFFLSNGTFHVFASRKDSESRAQSQVVSF